MMTITHSTVDIHQFVRLTTIFAVSVMCVPESKENCKIQIKMSISEMARRTSRDTNLIQLNSKYFSKYSAQLVLIFHSISDFCLNYLIENAPSIYHPNLFRIFSLTYCDSFFMH